MKSNHKLYLEQFFQKMNEFFPNKWCVLHSYKTLPYFSESDVDMAFSSNDIEKVEALIMDVAIKTDWQVYQKFWYDSQKCLYYVLKNDKNIFLALDFLIDNDGIGKYGFPTSMLTEKCEMFLGYIPIPNNATAFSYKYVKRIVKRRSPSENEKYLLKHYRLSDYDKIEEILTSQFGTEGMKLISKKLTNEDFSLTDKEMTFLMKKKKERLFKSNKIFKKLYWEILRILNRVFYPNGIIINIPELSDTELEIFTNKISKKVGLLFRFVKSNHSCSLSINLKGLIGSTLVINPRRKFNTNKVIQTHWLYPRYTSIDFQDNSFQNLENMVNIYSLAIEKVLLSRKRFNRRVMNEK